MDGIMTISYGMRSQSWRFYQGGKIAYLIRIRIEQVLLTRISTPSIESSKEAGAWTLAERHDCNQSRSWGIMSYHIMLYRLHINAKQSFGSRWTSMDVGIDGALMSRFKVHDLEKRCRRGTAVSSDLTSANLPLPLPQHHNILNGFNSTLPRRIARLAPGLPASIIPPQEPGT
jgi:hypothetical protein